MAALKPHLCKSFKFAPSGTTELFLKPHNILNAAPDGHRFDFFDFPNYLKMHLKFHPEIPLLSRFIKQVLNESTKTIRKILNLLLLKALRPRLWHFFYF